MKINTRLLVPVLAALVAGLFGYWFGFRDGTRLGVAAETLPRGSIAEMQIRDLKNQNLEKVIVSLEFDIDNGLLSGHRIFHDPLRHMTGWVWGMNYYPDYEKYIRSLADYRIDHPSPMESAKFDTQTDDIELREFNTALEADTKANLKTIDSVVKTYASPGKGK